MTRYYPRETRMATVEVGDNDQVFVFTRSAEADPPKPMTHELGKNDLMIVFEHHEGKAGIPCGPVVRVYVGGEPVGMIQELTLNASSKSANTQLEVKILSSEIDGLSDGLKTSGNRYLNLLKRLLPFVNIKEIGLNDELIHEQGVSVDPLVPLGD